MKITPKSRRQIRLQSALFYVLLAGAVGLLAWLSVEYNYQADWTFGNRNTIAPASRQLLATLDQPIEIVAYVEDNAALHQRVRERIKRLQRHKADIQLRFVNPELQPERATDAGITRPGQLLISMSGRSEIVESIGEQTLINALQRLSREEQRWAVFLEGHGERDPFDESNRGVSTLADNLKRSGLGVQGLNLIRTPVIPDNTAVLVVASPQTALLEGAVRHVQRYIDNGGNLLWLHDPGDTKGLQALTNTLGIEFVDGVIVDANPQLRALMGIKHPAVIPVVDYAKHPINGKLAVQTLFPFAVGIAVAADSPWTAGKFLTSLSRTWSETGSLVGNEITYNEGDGDSVGPLTIGVSLSRAHQGREQRIAVVGDSDFLSNGYLGNGGNLELALNIFNWLSRDDDLISIVSRPAPDTQVELSYAATITIAVAFLVVLPLGLAITGLAIWLRRRRR